MLQITLPSLIRFVCRTTTFMSCSKASKGLIKATNWNTQRIAGYWTLDHSTVFNTIKHSVKEIRIPTPFGHIAAVQYGDSNAENKMLAVHGMMDNCGTFEKLLPYIVQANDIHVIAMDEPGCGLSSPLPVGAEIPKYYLIKEMRRVVNYMNWSRFSIISHSKGSAFALLYASLLPESVQCVITLDTFQSFYHAEAYPYSNFDASILDEILKHEQKVLDNTVSKKVYSEEELIKKLMRRNLGVTESTARILLKRGMKACNGGFVYNHDSRCQFPVLGPMVLKEDHIKLAKKIRCDLLIFTTTHGPFWHFSKTEWFNIYRENCRKFKHILMEGNHYIHIDSPEEVASHINSFLEESLKYVSTT